MRDKSAYALATLGAVVLIRDPYLIFMVIPDEANQGMTYRLLYFPWWAAFIAVGLSAILQRFLPRHEERASRSKRSSATRSRAIPSSRNLSATSRPSFKSSAR
jgi:hypothetical protein